jgi:hypothetical protein
MKNLIIITMKNLFLYTVLIVILFTSSKLYAQNDDTDKSNFGISWSGFVKNDFFLDTRQTVSVREGHFLLYPSNVFLDNNKEDINAQGSINFLSIQSRLTGKITGPDALGAKTSGMIEGAFFGHTNSDINGFRLRHAFVKLDWSSTQLLFGQYWHMMFVPECFPGTISFNTGVPFQYFTRNPQIRITQKLGDKIKLSVAAATQRDFASPGGYTKLSNTMTPDIQGQLQFNSNDKIIIGITGGYKKMLPRLVTEQGYKAQNGLGGFTSNAFVKIKTEPVTFKLQGIFAQNAFDGLMIGGYAIKEITDVTKDYREYTPINTLSIWTDIHSNGTKLQTGIFAGFSKNMGSFDEINDVIFNSANFLYAEYLRGYNIDYVYRVSPRIIYNAGKLRLAAEVEHTVAAYAENDDNGDVQIDNHGKITESKEVANTRFLFSVYYFF